MTTLMDRNSKPVAYLYNNKIVNADTNEVIGVTLGDVVFGTSGEVKGKLFDRTFYAVSGDIVAKEQELRTMPGFDSIDVLFQGWKILEKIKEHGVPWIVPTERWTALDLADFMQSDENLIRVRHVGKKFSTGKLSF